MAIGEWPEGPLQEDPDFLAVLMQMRDDLTHLRAAFDRYSPVLEAYIPEPGTPAGWALQRKLAKQAKKGPTNG